MTWAVPETPAAIQSQLHVQTGSTQRQVCKRIAVSTGKHSPSQGRIDTMFRRPSTQLAQTDNASEAVRAEVDDSSDCYDDVTDTT